MTELQLPVEALPTLSSLVKQKPSDSIKWQVLDIVHSYVLVKRIYNGDWQSDPEVSCQSTDGRNAQKRRASRFQVHFFSKNNALHLQDICKTEEYCPHKWNSSPMPGGSLLSLKYMKVKAEFRLHSLACLARAIEQNLGKAVATVI